MITKLWTQDTGEGRTKQETVRADLGAPTTLGRRSFLRAALVGLAGVGIGVQMSGCAEATSRDVDNEGTSPPVRPTSPPSVAQPTAVQTTPVSTSSGSGSGSTVLLVYFSRAGENYFYGGRTNLTVGNTEVLAGMISQRIGCDVYRIEPVDPYSDNYDETVARNVREQDTNARPAIANPLTAIDSYDTMLLGSPIWNVRAPMIMSTFEVSQRIVARVSRWRERSVSIEMATARKQQSCNHVSGQPAREENETCQRFHAGV